MIDYDPHRWLHHLLDIKGSVVRQIFSRVLLCTLFAVLVVCLHVFAFSLAVSDRAHVLIGLVLGLLLVFRTNACYDRYWEGRRQWGSIINEARNLGRAASVLLAEAPDLLVRLLKWTMAFPRAVMVTLRNGNGTGAWLHADAEVQPPIGSHQPLFAAQQITVQLDEARRRGLISDVLLAEVDRNTQMLIDYCGACERIRRTPLPFAYVVHLRRVLILYCYTLPFALLDSFGWGTIPVTLLLCYALFGIEEIGVEIEDPFADDDNDLPLERFCETIENNLRPLLPLPSSSTPTNQAILS